VITGVAERGLFADTRTSVEIEKALLRDPIYASLKRTAPKIFDAFVEGLARETERATTNEEILAAAQELFSELVDRLLPHAPDHLVLEEASVFIGYLDRLKSIDPESCAALADGKGAELKIDLHQKFPDLGEREIAFRNAMIVFTDPDRALPSASAVEPFLTKVFKKMEEQFGADADLLGKDALKPGEYKRYCEVMAAFYREITTLPAAQAADVLRHLYSER
jgi:hypothetical protein